MRVSSAAFISSCLSALAVGIGTPALASPSGASDGVYAAQASGEAQPGETQPEQVAQNANAGAEGDPSMIVVTAQKRAENIQDVPISMTAIGDERIKNLPLTNVSDMISYVPSLRTASPGNAASSGVTLRGVGQRDINMHNEGAVAMFFDGTYVSFVSAIAQPFYDLERIEVLKGPQGTLFGRNATGGLIHVISKRPTRDFEGFVTAQYGSYDEVKLEGAISGPLSETVSARASGFYNRADGYIENKVGPDLLALDTLGGRLQLLFEPTDTFSFLLSGRTYQAFDVPGAALLMTPYVADATGLHSPRSHEEYTAFCLPLTGGVAPPLGAERTGNCFTQRADSFNDNVRFGQDYNAFTATAEWSVSDAITLTSITDYQRISMDYIVDADGTTSLYFPYSVFNNKSDQISQELRVAGSSSTFDWVAGVYYLDINYDLTVLTDLYLHPGYGTALPTDYVANTKSGAVFGQLDWEFVPKLKLSLGARVMRDEKSMTNRAQCIANPALVPANICEILDTFAFPGALAFNRTYKGEIKDNSWSGRAVLQYDPNEDTMFYAGVTRGTKGGGFNAGGAQFYTLAEVPFEPEVLINYEVGMKAAFANRRISLDTSLFYYDYSDYQTVSFGTSGALQILNVDATVKGVELALSARPTNELSLSLGGLYLDTEQKDVPMGNGQFGDFQIPDAPKWSLTGEVRYEVPVNLSDSVAIQLNGVYVGERSISAIDYPDQRLDAYTKFDARLTYSLGDSWDFAVFANNFTDEKVQTARVDFTTIVGAAVDTYDRPRWFGILGTYSF